MHSHPLLPIFSRARVTIDEESLPSGQHDPTTIFPPTHIQVYRDLLTSISSVEEADKKMAELASQGKIDPAFLQITAKVTWGRHSSIAVSSIPLATAFALMTTSLLPTGRPPQLLRAHPMAFRRTAQPATPT